MSDSDIPPAEPLRWTALNPYLSVVVLECTTADPVKAFAELTTLLAKPGRRRVGRHVRVVATAAAGTLANDTLDGLGALSTLGIDQVWASVRQQSEPPPWASIDSPHMNTIHLLTVALRRQGMVAVHTDESTRSRLQRWLNQNRMAPFQRVAPEIIEAVLLSGEARALWLQGTHARRHTKADIKNIYGLDLREALRPHEDSSYALGAGRAELADHPDRKVLTGTVGAAPGSSSAWLRATPDFPTFVAGNVELFTALEAGWTDEAPAGFSMLARPVADLSRVSGAYEVMITDPDMLAIEIDGGTFAAARLFQENSIEVIGDPSSAAAALTIGAVGGERLTLTLRPQVAPNGFILDIGPKEGPISPAHEAAESLQDAGLIAVYYRSGHTYRDGRIFQEQIPRTSFPNWRFCDFNGYYIDQEKPTANATQDIHDKTGVKGDKSLFAWVVETYKDGHLICDDQSGETADFLQISSSLEILRFIHVKKSGSVSEQRQISASAHEVVIGQAVKNLVWMDFDSLRTRLASPSIKKPACWNSGVKGSDRTEFLRAFDRLDATSRTEIVIVQPHVRKSHYNNLHRRQSDHEPINEDILRLHLLEGLLNAARSATAGVGADLFIVGSAD